MLIASAITGYLDRVILELTPLQRWDAVRSFEGGISPGLVNVVVGISIIAALVAIFLFVSSNKAKVQKNFSDNLFIELAQTRGLTLRQRQLLLDVAINAGLKKNESIFTLSDAFDRSALQLVQQTVIEQGPDESENVKTELAFVREKLGFKINQAANQIPPIEPDRAAVSSIEIPEGKKLHIQHRGMTSDDDIRASVIRNDDNGITVEFSHPVDVNFGQTWLVRYHADNCIWEFDTTAVSCSGDVVVFKHSDNIRLINRRRFLRVPVKKAAYVASFPFAKKLAANFDLTDSNGNVNQTVLNGSASLLDPPSFVPAVVTELGGPGLKIDCPFEAEEGDRLLLIFRLTQKNTAAMPRPVSPGAAVEKIIEDIAIVRHVTPNDSGFTLALELTGLTDDDISEMVRATNDANMDRDKNDSDKGSAEISIGKIPERLGV